MKSNIKKIEAKFLCLLVLLALLAGCGRVPGSQGQEGQGSPSSLNGAVSSPSASEPALPASDSALSASEAARTPAPSPTAEPTPSPTPQPTPVPEITLVMIGDILQHTRVAESGKTETGEYDFTRIFENVREEISQADLALVNQEVIIGGEELGISGYPCFNAPYELGDALAETGFDVVLHATNHALDKGRRGVENCLAFWRQSYPDMGVLGIHDSQESQQEIYVWEKQGIRLAILNYTYGTNGIPMPADMPYAVDMLERERVASDLQKARELADMIIVCPHWGTEYVLEQTPQQEEWAEFLAENGADLILGTHPHVIEPVKWVTADNGNRALVYYSLGNFVNWTSGTGKGVANRMVGAMARVTITLDSEGEAVISQYAAEPLVCHVEEGFGGVTVYPLEEYTEELAAGNRITGQDGDFSLEYCRKLVEKVFGEKSEFYE